MCILFLHFDNDPQDDNFKVIIGNNRDEFYSRPTKPADFWEDNADCISGLDLQPGREGGTWLGMSKKGKIGILLNILQGKPPDPQKKGRGSLVNNFLTSGLSAEEYLTELKKTSKDYSGFNLVLMEERDKKWTAMYFSNFDDTSPHKIPPGTYVLSNHIWSKPWNKTKEGLLQFEEILSDFNSVDKLTQLTNKTIEMLNNETTYMPDAQMESQFPEGTTKLAGLQRSAIYVNSAQLHYGTRTNTVVTINQDNQCCYVERTMKEPIDVSDIQWQTVQHNFEVESLTSKCHLN